MSPRQNQLRQTLWEAHRRHESEPGLARSRARQTTHVQLGGQYSCLVPSVSAATYAVAGRSILFGCNVFIPAEHLAGFGYPDAVFAGSNDALIIF
jgi:hypothetical protein